MERCVWRKGLDGVGWRVREVGLRVGGKCRGVREQVGRYVEVWWWLGWCGWLGRKEGSRYRSKPLNLPNASITHASA